MEHCRRLSAHPAEQALGPELQERLGLSDRNPRWDREARETWVDSGGAS
ncbi:hypothetical protein [Streptomyces sp. NPDC049887]